MALALWMLAGLGIGMSFPTLSVLMLGLSAEGQQGRHSAALQLADALATTAALALCGALFTSMQADARPQSFAAVFGAAALIVVSGFAVCERVRPGQQSVGASP
jgi:MFS family permease